MTFYTLMQHRTSGSIWSIEYGTSDQAMALAELSRYRSGGIPEAMLRILETPDAHHPTIMAAVNALNSGRQYPAKKYHYTSAPWRNRVSR